MCKHKCTIEELHVLLDNKLNEDLILTMLIDNNIVELHKRDENGIYKLRFTKLPKKEFNKIIKKELYYKLSEWYMLDENDFYKLLNHARNYLEDLFFEL